MGLLDDAIKEHLDLKRRRGADPAEVERLEREALGPVRRNRDPGEPVMAEDEMPAGGGFAYDQDDDRDWGHEPLVADERDDPRVGYADDLAAPETGYEEDLLEEPGFEPEEAPPAAAKPERMRPRSLRRDVSEDAAPADWGPDGGDELSPEPFPTTSGSPRRSVDDPAGDETTEYRVDEAHGPHHDEPDEDMLEETPEFLQDTPDHDRLWFEQRPPRDFDFDG
ncbi:MAG TPA: hypothetical protein VFN87_19100 [Solirubrobacteraceae bacterium]|nr:hypothetical protein [Solirubrobacteraceae bacterium]